MPGVGTSAFASASDVFSLVRSLVNDADIPSNIPITTAQRAGNLVTITTNQPHGLQVGSTVQIGFVSDSSFNSTQQATVVPSATTFQFPQAGPNTTSGNGTVSVLIQGDWATDAVLMNYINKAYRKVQMRLNMGGSKTMTNDVVLAPSMPAGTTQLNDTSTPQLPPDFLAPREVYEKIAGTPYFGAPMRQVNALPNGPQGALNGCFSWFNETLNFNGASGDIDIRLRYFSGFPRISDGTSQILIRDGIDAVASHTAMLASGARNGPAAAMYFEAMFEKDMAELKNAQAHARQYVVGRRRPNNSRRGGCRGFGETV